MPTAFVLDASAALRLVCHDPMAASWAEQLQQASLVLAPELMLTEVANALWKLQRAGSLAGLDPQLLLADARDLVDQIDPDRHLQVEALALARREAAVLLTADQRLQRLADKVLP